MFMSQKITQKKLEIKPFLVSSGKADKKKKEHEEGLQSAKRVVIEDKDDNKGGRTCCTCLILLYFIFNSLKGVALHHKLVLKTLIAS